jgi:hypothetical protein
MPDQPQYHWRISVDYRHGYHQSWHCPNEAEARQEFAHQRARHAAGKLPEVLTIRLERQPIPDWETVRIAPEVPEP